MSESLSKINPNEITIERITEKHNIKDFQSYEKELTKFLVEDALENQKKRISVTYLWFLRNDELVGYITVLNDRINLEGDLKTGFREKGIQYHSLPAIKIGRLCVDNRFLRRGVGTLMIDFVIRIAFQVYERYSGCRFLVLDAKRNKENEVIHFYKKQRFIALKEREKGITPMFFDLVNNIKFRL
ncbi:GNAT family N-acetyltransferase [Candidatus Woesearchaeota archaeon]|nr:GNAT family N-acetyltransferase [Candidatus Woesearchaeota archaeon]